MTSSEMWTCAQCLYIFVQKTSEGANAHQPFRVTYFLVNDTRYSSLSSMKFYEVQFSTIKFITPSWKSYKCFGCLRFPNRGPSVCMTWCPVFYPRRSMLPEYSWLRSVFSLPHPSWVGLLFGWHLSSPSRALRDRESERSKTGQVFGSKSGIRKIEFTSCDAQTTHSTMERSASRVCK